MCMYTEERTVFIVFGIRENTRSKWTSSPGEHDPAISGHVINHSPEFPGNQTPQPDVVCCLRIQNNVIRPPLEPSFIINNGRALYAAGPATPTVAHPP